MADKEVRLIDANVLLEKQYNIDTWNTAIGDFGLPVVEVYDIQDAPTIEAEPVRHGEWKKAELGGVNHCKCSKCDYPVTEGEAEVFAFCPRCGAKMDGGSDND